MREKKEKQYPFIRYLMIISHDIIKGTWNIYIYIYILFIKATNLS